jgi:Leucine-rich repeat (LRR) protein/predicted acylesterase/phospholipase RssA
MFQWFQQQQNSFSSSESSVPSSFSMPSLLPGVLRSNTQSSGALLGDKELLHSATPTIGKRGAKKRGRGRHRGILKIAFTTLVKFSDMRESNEMNHRCLSDEDPSNVNSNAGGGTGDAVASCSSDFSSSSPKRHSGGDIDRGRRESISDIRIGQNDIEEKDDGDDDEEDDEESDDDDDDEEEEDDDNDDDDEETVEFFGNERDQVIELELETSSSAAFVPAVRDGYMEFVEAHWRRREERRGVASPMKESARATTLPMMSALKIVSTPPFDTQMHSLPSDLNALLTLQKLQIKHQRMPALSPKLAQLKMLRVLLLSHNRVAALTNDVCKLRSLVTLDLSHNELTTLPSHLSRLTRLRELRINHNAIVTLPDSIGSLAKLRLLDCAANKLTSLPASIASLTALRHLDASKNAIVRLRRGGLFNRMSSAASQLATQQRRDDEAAAAAAAAAGGKAAQSSSSSSSSPGVDDGVKMLSVAIGMLERLEYLDMSGNKMALLTFAIGKLGRARALRLQHNSIGALPPTVGNLQRVAVLDVSWNALRTLPAEVGSMSSLRSLNLSHNEIALLPPSLAHLSALEELALEHNRLDDADNLRCLGESLQRLRVLDVSYNAALRTLPSSLGALGALEILDCSHCALRKLSPSMFSERLASLRVLDVSFNSLKALPPELGSLPALSIFSAEENQLVSCPASLERLTSLRILRLYSTQVMVLPTRLPASLTELTFADMMIDEALGEVRIGHAMVRTLCAAGRGSRRRARKQLRKRNQLAAPLKHRLEAARVYDGRAAGGGSASVGESDLLAGRSKKAASTRADDGDDGGGGDDAGSGSGSSDGGAASSTDSADAGNVNSADDGEKRKRQRAQRQGLALQFQMLLSLLHSSPHRLLLYAIAVLGEHKRYRDILLERNAFRQLIELLDADTDGSGGIVTKAMRYQAAKALSNLTEDTHTRARRSLAMDHAEVATLIDLALSCKHQGDLAARALLVRCLANLGLHRSLRDDLLRRFGADQFRLMSASGAHPAIARQVHRLLSIYGVHDFRSTPLRKRRGIRILALDGGGVKALVTLELLKKIEAITGHRIVDMFDVIAGTSTGAALAGLIGLRKFPLDKCELLYKALAKKVFVIGSTSSSAAAKAAAEAVDEAEAAAIAAAEAAASSGAAADLSQSDVDAIADAAATSSSSPTSSEQSSPWARLFNVTHLMRTGAYYQSKHLLDALIKQFGTEPMIETSCDPTVPKCLFVSSLVSVAPARIFCWRNYQCPLDAESRYAGTCTEMAPNAIRASTAAPTYFDAFVLGDARHVDGAIVANNPTAVAVHEARRIFGYGVPIDCVLSLGTGGAPEKQARKGLAALMAAVVGSATSSERTANILEDVLLREAKVPYYRFSPTSSELDFGIDETRQAVLDQMQRVARDFVQQNIQEFHRCCELLLLPDNE